jgi:hypothetical protein
MQVPRALVVIVVTVLVLMLVATLVIDPAQGANLDCFGVPPTLGGLIGLH